MDKLNAERRSANMSRIRSKDTSPELSLRRLLHRLGYRYRLHRKDLPGRPDLVIPGRRKIIFVHGCFWHQHEDCREGRVPTSRTDYWGPKLKRNEQRDEANLIRLEHEGWKVLIVWECELKNSSKTVLKTVRRFLGPAGASDQ